MLAARFFDVRFDFACGSGSLLLNVRHRMKDSGGTIGKIHGMEKNITTYNLARMNILREANPAKMPRFDAVVANPPFSYRWEPREAMSEDIRFKNHGIAPKSHPARYLRDDGAEHGVAALVLPPELGRGEVDLREQALEVTLKGFLLDVLKPFLQGIEELAVLRAEINAWLKEKL